MSESFEPFEALYARGMAYGHSDVKTDTMHFTFKGEKFSFPTMKAWPFAKYNGYFYEASINDLRKLEAELASG